MVYKPEKIKHQIHGLQIMVYKPWKLGHIKNMVYKPWQFKHENHGL